MDDQYDAIIVGAGAAGLLCAREAGLRGRRVLLLEHNSAPGAKILISGGGRCNFTNIDVRPTRYLSGNPHFAKSALSRYTAWDFMDMIGAHGISWHEKTLGQLFCDQGARAILDALLTECDRAGVVLRCGQAVRSVEYLDGLYRLALADGWVAAPKLVIATGGLSIPKMGATGFAYDVARRFGLEIQCPEPALVPFTFADHDLAFMKALAGVAADSSVQVGKTVFREALLFTHRGLSGPAILQISSYWHAGDALTIDLLPDLDDVAGWLKNRRTERGKAGLKAILSDILPARLAEAVAAPWPGNMADLSNPQIEEIKARLGQWTIVPTGTEGFQKAEVTRGGVCTSGLSSKTMEAKAQPGLHFIGECVDVTGWLGGYNFQWAWSSAWAAAQAL